MRGFYKPSDANGDVRIFGKRYEFDHLLFNACTLYLDEKTGKGITVIQQAYDPKTKHTWWGEVEPGIANDLYLSENFKPFFDSNAALPDENGAFPLIKLRKIMWSLRMPPIKKEEWEE